VFFTRRRPEGSRNSLLGLLALAVVLLSPVARAVEVMPFAGIVDVTPISGCCRHVSAAQGYGAMMRLQNVNKFLGDVEIVGYSDFKYSEASFAKYIYLYGAEPQVDPNSSVDVAVTRFSTWKVTLSYGLGFFTHNTKTERYDLPALVAGVQAVSRIMLGYTLSDKWSVNGIVSTGLGYSLDETDFDLGTGLGFSYRF
jgi:hypothetical protein